MATGKSRGLKFLGFEIKRIGETDKKGKVENLAGSGLPDGSTEIVKDPYSGLAGAGFSYDYTFNFEAELKKEAELIADYRYCAELPDVAVAIDDIVNEAIVVEEEAETVEISLKETDYSENIQNKIREEFDYLLSILSFDMNAQQIFRQWYIDGKQYYWKRVDSKNLKDGIQELRWLDPCKTKKIKEKDEDKGTEVEWYVYDPEPKNKKKDPTKTILKINPDAVSFVSSGLINLETGRALSNLQKALKPANQLSYLEDSLVVYRLSRAPERRVFYIDVGNLPKTAAEQYLSGIIKKFKNKLTYNTQTGKVDATKAHISMMEDIWLPRKEGGKGTEVTTLQAGQNLGDIEDIVYFRQRLYRSLNLPLSRMDTESLFNIGNSSEITRDEIKFSKFVDRVRRRFTLFFYDILRTQCLLKGIVTEKDWTDNQEKITFEFNRDSYFAELKKTEIQERRMDSLERVDPFVGKYFTKAWVMENVLHMTEEEIAEMNKEIDKEKEERPEDFIPIEQQFQDEPEEEVEEEPAPTKTEKGQKKAAEKEKDEDK